jgi:hypothetical protein
LNTCFNCGRTGHWAKDCARQSCPKCNVRIDWHTEAGIIECAWRGEPSAADSEIRARTPERRDNTADCYCPSPGSEGKGGFRSRGMRYPDVPPPYPFTYIGPPERGPRPDRREEAARQVAEFRASPAYPGTIPTHTPQPIANTLPGD